MKLFQIEEPDGSPVDPDAPGAAVGIDVSGAQAEVAIAVGGNAVVLSDREDFPLDLTVPPISAAAQEWRDLFEGARLRAERALARPVTHAVIVAATKPNIAAQLHSAATATGLTLLDLLPPEAMVVGEPKACAAAIRAEELAPRPEAPGSGHE